MNCARTLCKKLAGLLNCCTKMNGLLKIVDSWKLQQRQKEGVETIVEVSNPFLFVVSGSRAGVLTRPGLRPGELVIAIVWN